MKLLLALILLLTSCAHSSTCPSYPLPANSLPLIIVVERDGDLLFSAAEEACKKWGPNGCLFGGYAQEEEIEIPGIVRIVIGSPSATSLSGEPSYVRLGLQKGSCNIRWQEIVITADIPRRFLTRYITHEIGHALGYGHSDKITSCMYQGAVEGYCTTP